MSKVICEICGTAYPDTEKECPVCGFEKPETAEFVPDDLAGAKASGHVRGGRFSQPNVNKKLKAQNAAGAKGTGKSPKSKKSNAALKIAAVLLALVVVFVGVYIYFTYFAKPPVDDTVPPQTTTQAQTVTTLPTETTLITEPTQTQGTTVPVEIPCIGLTIHEQSVVLSDAVRDWILNVVPSPANTTDEIIYSSADENVATVSADGKITAVATGETVITITCGKASAECKVVCEVTQQTEPDETEPDVTEPEATEPEETEPESVGDFKLNREDFSLAVGDSWRLYNGDIDPDEITWRSSDTSVATVTNGRVKGVGKGYAWITAEYKGVKLKSIVYVQ